MFSESMWTRRGYQPFPERTPLRELRRFEEGRPCLVKKIEKVSVDLLTHSEVVADHSFCPTDPIPRECVVQIEPE